MAAHAVYKTRPIKRKPVRVRRSRAEIEALENALVNLLASENPMTVRQVFYRMVSIGAIDKTEKEYKNTICRLLGKLRRDGRIAFEWLSDQTRWMRKPRTDRGLEAALRRTAELYRRDVWAELPVYVEIWLEKDALAGVLYEETEIWDVPLMVTRGYASLSYLHGAAETINALEKPAYLYYFGDYDPSGVDITRAVEAGIREFAPDAEIHFERVAVTYDQIRAWDLPTRPTKQSDSRSKNFGDESVEVDAILPAQLRELVRACIVRHIDPNVWGRLQRIEEAERETLINITESWQTGQLQW